jgi:hypothetical protein
MATAKKSQIIHHGEKLDAVQIAALMADATGWVPADGDEIEGTVLGAKWGYSDVSERQYPIVFLLLDEGETYQRPDDDRPPSDVVAIHALQTVIESEMFSLRPQPGERLYVKKIGARGQAKRKGYSPTVAYAVTVPSRTADDSAAFWDHGTARRGSTVPPEVKAGEFDEPMPE